MCVGGVHCQRKPTTVMLITMGIYVSELLVNHLVSVNCLRSISGKSDNKTMLHCPLMVKTATTTSRLQSCLAVQVFQV